MKDKIKYFMSLRCSYPKQLLGIFICWVLIGSGFAIAQEPNIAGIIVNNTNSAIDVYVVIPPSDDNPQESSELLQTVQAGTQATDFFNVNEVILVTRTGSDDVLQSFKHDGTPNKVFIVPAQLETSGRAASQSPVVSENSSEQPKKGGCPKNLVNCDAVSNNKSNQPKEVETKKPEVIISDGFKEWLETDKTVYSTKGRNIDDSEGKNSFQTQWLLEDDVRHGYNILKMNPSDLTDSGINSPRTLFDTFGKDSKSWHWDKYKIALANDLVIHKAEESFGQESTSMTFTSHEELKSRSTSIGLGATTKSGQGVTGKVGWGRDEGKVEASGQTLIRKQQVGRAYWVCYVKEYMRLDQDFSKFLLNRKNLKSYAQFKDFFEEYGTHWPLCTYFGGWINYEERLSNKELAEHVKDSFSVSANAKVPAGKAPVSLSGSVDYSKTDKTSSKNKDSNSKAKWYSKGGTLGGNIGMWQMQDPTSASSYIPVQLELREINEIIWPELMGITDAEDANYIHNLRAKMTSMLQRYYDEAKGPSKQYDWKPRLYEFKVEKIIVTKDDDKGLLNASTTPKFFGLIQMFATNSDGGVSINDIWSENEDDPFVASKLDKFKLKKNTMLATVSATPVPYKENGKTFYRPAFSGGDGFFNVTVGESDDEIVGGSDFFIFNGTISFDEVERQPNKVLKRTKEVEVEDVAIKVFYQVKRVNYDFEKGFNFKPAKAPHLAKKGQGAAVAAKGAKVVVKADSEASSAEQKCYNQVQGKVAWSTSGQNSWNQVNVKNLCKGVSDSTVSKRINCFSSRMPKHGWEKAISSCAAGKPVSTVGNAEQKCYDQVQGKVAWSVTGQNSWAQNNVKDLCKGVSDSTIKARINCFSSRMPKHGWEKAISSCAAGKPVSTVSNAEQKCYDQVQGKVAWSTSGDKSWNPDNVKSLCKGVREHAITGRIICFSSQMPVFEWKKAISNCNQI